MNSKMYIGHTGYYMQVSSYNHEEENPVVMINLHDPSGTIIDRYVVNTEQIHGVFGLTASHYGGANDTNYWDRDPQ